MGLLELFNNNPVFIRPKMSISMADNCPANEQGVCLVVGTAPCWKTDVDAALLKFPDADICLVNEATRLGLPAKHFATCHPERLDQFLPEDSGLILHIKATEHKVNRAHYRHATTLGASSALFAAATMRGIGYELVVLCGCPMDGGGGYAPEIGDTHPSVPSEPRIGMITTDHKMVQAWHRQLYEMPTEFPEVCSGIRSMSGFTKKIFGGLDDN